MRNNIISKKYKKLKNINSLTQANPMVTRKQEKLD